MVLLLASDELTSVSSGSEESSEEIVDLYADAMVVRARFVELGVFNDMRQISNKNLEIP